MPCSMVLLVCAKLDIMKFQDSTVKDVPMDKSGTELNAAGTQHVQVDTHGTHNITDATPRPFHAHKMLNGTELCACVPQDTIWLDLSVLNVHQALPGTERPAVLKFPPTNAEATKSSSTANASVKMDLSTLMELACNAQLAPHGTANSVTVPQPVVGVWVSRTLKQSMEDVHAWLDTSSLMVAVSASEFFLKNSMIYCFEPRFIYVQILFFVFLKLLN